MAFPSHGRFCLISVFAQVPGKADPRDQTNPAWMTGMSFNPIAFVRLSAGGYLF
jgi:hypothetical protein